jgi:drug/metabolite transporter (DMT)-like permease
MVGGRHRRRTMQSMHGNACHKRDEKPFGRVSRTAMGRPEQSAGRAVLWMLGAAAGSTLFAIIGREASRHMPLGQLVFWRSAFALPIVVAVTLSFGGVLAALKTQRFSLHVARNVVHFAGQYCWLYAVSVVPLAFLFAIEFTSPLWIVLFAPLLLGERVTRTRLIAAAVGFTGVFVIVRPDSVPLNSGTLAALGAAISLALSVIAIKRLTSTERPQQILFYMSALHTLFAFVMLQGAVVIPSATGGALAALLAVTGLAVHYCMSRAYTLGDALLVTPVDFVRLPLIAIVGAALYGEALDVAFVVGAVLIVMANWWNLRGATRGEPRS